MFPARPPARTRRVPRRAIPAVALTLAVGMALPLVAASAAGAESATDAAPVRTIDVVGTGIVRGTPDILELVLGIEVRAKSAADALTRNSELLRKVLSALRDAGVVDDDTQTAELSIRPVSNDDGTAVIGYSVSNTLQVTLRDLDAAGSVVDTVTQIADDEIVVHGLSFSFDDNSRLVARARAEAVRQARAQADQLAEAADVTLGRLLSIRETSAPASPVLRSGDSGVSESSVPIEPGTERLAVQASLQYEIA